MSDGKLGIPWRIGWHRKSVPKWDREYGSRKRQARVGEGSARSVQASRGQEPVAIEMKGRPSTISSLLDAVRWTRARMSLVVEMSWI